MRQEDQDLKGVADTGAKSPVAGTGVAGKAHEGGDGDEGSPSFGDELFLLLDEQSRETRDFIWFAREEG